VISPSRTLAVAFSLTVFACSSAPAPTPAAESGAPKPEPAKVEASAPRPTPVPSDPAKKFYEGLGGGKLPTAGPPEDEAEGPAKVEKLEVIVDPATGKKMRRVPKDPTLMERNGRLFSSIVSDSEGLLILRKDEKYYYLEALPERTPEDLAREAQREAEDAAKATPILELPAEEAEVVAPRVSKTRIRLAEISGGLPKAGIWRDNFALADLDGDGRPEIVSPPPRLSGQGLRVFRFLGDKWTTVNVQLENPQNLRIGYGGVAISDLDGDGKPDVLWGGHGAGLAVAFNLGDFRFRAESRNLPSQMSTRAVAIGDLDGDGKNDILAISDMPEFLQTGGKEVVGADGYVQGHDVRAFMNQDGRFAELLAGLDQPCFGYSLALEVPKAESIGKPFFVSGCRYAGGLPVLYEFSRARMAFENVGLRTVEAYSAHLGSGIGRYRGHPAAVVSYIKNGPGTATPDITGDGVSIYYREGETWKRKRVFKRLGLDRSTSAAVAMGDLNGDGLDDVAFADDGIRRLRVFFQTPTGDFEELDPALEPTFENAPSSLRVADVDGDGRADIVLMLHYLTGHETRVGGFRFWRNRP